ncbi:MAG TPA: ABC transporter ATP-binding protein [Actinomycetota bacterium]|nr:ABC transporter ATP-binding protein [Actinomycetota bacterium]
MTLDARVVVRRPQLHLDVALSVAPGETVALLGPNGAGKSTFIGAVAGVVPLDDGAVRARGVTWEDRARRVRVAPQRRSVGVVFQDLRLFPALDAAANVAYGLRAAGVSRAEARRRAGALLDRLGAGDLAARRPAQLSGGEAQRVALARALAVEPDVLLLDEPLSALDATARAAARRVVRDVLAAFGGAAVLVTHDPLEAAALGDRLVVVERGRVVQSGTPADVRARPRSAYVADLAGTNLLTGTVERRPGGAVLVTPDGELAVVAEDVAHGAPALAAVHPRAVTLAPRRPETSARNVVRAVVARVEPAGDRVRVLLDGRPPLTAEITAGAVEELDLRVGDETWAVVKATQVDVYPA